jgi:hypothetical protein
MDPCPFPFEISATASDPDDREDITDFREWIVRSQPLMVTSSAGPIVLADEQGDMTCAFS